MATKPTAKAAPVKAVAKKRNNTKAQLLGKTVEHVDITSYDARPIIDSMRKMSFSSRDTARAADIFNMALKEKGCSTWLILAGSTSAGGCMHVYRDMVKFGMIDAIIATGRLDRRHGFLRGPRLQALPGRWRSGRQRPARRTTSTASTTPTSTRKTPGRAITRSSSLRTRSNRAATPRVSSSTKWASGWPTATPRRKAR